MANTSLKQKLNDTIAQVDRVFTEVKRQKPLDVANATAIADNKTQIQVNANAIATKADQTDLNNLAARVGVNETNIATKAEKSYVDAELLKKGDKTAVDKNTADLILLNNVKVLENSGNIVNLPSMDGSTKEKTLITQLNAELALSSRVSIQEYRDLATENGLPIAHSKDTNQTTTQLIQQLPTNLSGTPIYWVTGSDGDVYVQWNPTTNSWDPKTRQNVEGMKTDISTIQQNLNLPSGSTIDLTRPIADIVAGLPTTNIKDNEIVQIVGNDGVQDYKFNAGLSQWFAFSSNVVTTRNVSDPDPTKTQLEILDGLDLTGYKIGDITNVTGVDVQGNVSTLPFIFNGIPQPIPVPAPLQNTYFTQQVSQPSTGGGAFKVSDILGLPELDKAQLGFALTGKIPDIVTAGQTKTFTSGTIPSLADLLAFKTAGYKIQLNIHEKNTVQKDLTDLTQIRIDTLPGSISDMITIGSDIYIATSAPSAFARPANFIYKSTDGINFTKIATLDGRLGPMLAVGSNIYVASEARTLWLSTDGINFNVIQTFSRNITSLTSAGTTVYVGDATNAIFRSLNGTTFNKVATLSSRPDSMVSVGTDIYVGTDDASIYKSTDGINFTKIATLDSKVNALSTDGTNIYAGTGRIFRKTNSIWKSTDGTNFTKLVTLVDPIVRLLCVGTDVYASLVDYTVWQSTDGTNFNQIVKLDGATDGLTNYGSNIYAGTYAKSLFNLGARGTGTSLSVVDEIYDLGTTQWEITGGGTKTLPINQVLDANHSLVITKL